MGVAVRTWGHSYRARLRLDLSCVAEAQIFRDCDPNVYLSGISDIFRFHRERQVASARAVPRARHHRSFECRDHTRKGAAEVFRCSGKALEFAAGHARRQRSSIAQLHYAEKAYESSIRLNYDRRLSQNGEND